MVTIIPPPFCDTRPTLLVRRKLSGGDNKSIFPVATAMAAIKAKKSRPPQKGAGFDIIYCFKASFYA